MSPHSILQDGKMTIFKCRHHKRTMHHLNILLQTMPEKCPVMIERPTETDGPASKVPFQLLLVHLTVRKSNDCGSEISGYGQSRLVAETDIIFCESRTQKTCRYACPPSSVFDRLAYLIIKISRDFSITWILKRYLKMSHTYFRMSPTTFSNASY